MKIFLGILICSLMVTPFAQENTESAEVPSDEPMFNWQSGPITADLGHDLAQIELDSNYSFLSGPESKQIMQMMGNQSTDKELGMVISKARGMSWFLLFEFEDVGYVSDEEKDNIDAEAILKNISEGTEADNARRLEAGGREIHVLGWYVNPKYDENTNNIVWAIKAESGGDTITNYNTRILGRSGYTSVVLVSSLKMLDTVKGEVETLLGNFSYKDGSRYAEWVKGDKIAEYGLTALIAGGAGFAAVKLGLLGYLAKFWKMIALGVVGFFAAMKNKIMGLFRSKDVKTIDDN